MIKQYNKRLIWHLFIVQLSLMLIIACIVSPFYGLRGFCSAIFGGMVCLVPNVLFAKIVFKHGGALFAKQIAQDFYRGEGIKIVVTAILFALALIQNWLLPVIFFITYIVTQFAHWIVPFISGARRT